MKRILAIVMVLFCFCLVGCGDNSSSTSEADTSVQEETEVTSPETTEPEEDKKTMDNDSFIAEVKSSIGMALAPRDEVEDVYFDGRDLYVIISLERRNALERFTGVTDKIIEIQDGYDLWDSITVDFGSEGRITKTKDDIDGASFKVDESDIVK